MRTAAEIAERREAYRRLALEHRGARRYVEASACALITSTLTWVLGNIKDPAIRVKLDR